MRRLVWIWRSHQGSRRHVSGLKAEIWRLYNDLQTVTKATPDYGNSITWMDASSATPRICKVLPVKSRSIFTVTEKTDLFTRLKRVGISVYSGELWLVNMRSESYQTHVCSFLSLFFRTAFLLRFHVWFRRSFETNSCSHSSTLTYWDWAMNISNPCWHPAI